MKNIIIISTILFLLSGCGGTYEYWDISKFRMDKDALKNNEPIKLIYTSQAPDDNKEFEYYIHLIAVSQKTGDTVNILTTADNGLSMKDKDKVFNYFDEDNFVTKVSQIDPEKIKEIKDIEGLKKLQGKDISKVARDPKFDNIADNNFPTVVGSIGMFAPGNE